MATKQKEKRQTQILSVGVPIYLDLSKWSDAIGLAASRFSCEREITHLIVTFIRDH